MRRDVRLLLLVVSAAIVASAATVSAIAVNAATSDTPVPVIGTHTWWWVAGSTLAIALAALLWRWSEQRYEAHLKALIPVPERLQGWVVPRPASLDEVVRALRTRQAASVGITTALQSAGGFGKTTVARMVRADPRMLRRFGGRIYWVTLGRDAQRATLLERVTGLIIRIDPDRAPTFPDVQAASEYLAALLASGPRRLVVVDDVWTEEQLAAFPVAGRCARLVTTRVASLTIESVPIRVDTMTEDEARQLLTYDLPSLPPWLATALLAETGRYALLLRLANRFLRQQIRTGAEVTSVAKDLLAQLRASTITMDTLNQEPAEKLDVSDPRQRERAVSATIEASTGLLRPDELDRLAELAVFVEDESPPVPLVALLWHATAQMSEPIARGLCDRLADLALISLAPQPPGAITMHDVIRDYLTSKLGSQRAASLHGTLIGAVADGLPTVAAAVEHRETSVVAWWDLPPDARYLREHLVEHLLAADRLDAADQLAGDLRWIHTRLDDAGPAAPIADLLRIGTPRAVRMSRLLTQTAHLLSPTDPPNARLDILHDRVFHDPDWGPQARWLAGERPYPALRTAWPLADLADPAMRRVLTGHTGPVRTVAIAPDGTWLATGGDDETVRMWDTATGRPRALLAGHTGPVLAVAIAPDGTWLATGGDDETVRIWDAATGDVRATLTGHTGTVRAVAIAPDGTWLATGDDHMVRIWDAASGDVRATLTGHTGAVNAVAVSPDGSWVATGGYDETVRTWNVDTGRLRVTLTGRTGGVYAVAIAPDGSWLATGGGDKAVRIWDAATGRLRGTFTGHTGGVYAVAIAPDGSWLATGSDDETARIWDAATGDVRATLTGHTGAVNAVAVSPDGSWVATGGYDETLRIRNVDTGRLRVTLTGRTGGVYAVAIAPDGSWLATGSGDKAVRIWDVATGRLSATLTGRTGGVYAVAIAPDGSWLATGSDDETARIWDAETGDVRATLTGHTGPVNAVAIAPNGSWLATGSDDETARIWDAETGDVRATLTGHTGPVNAVAIAPNGSWLATGSDDETARIWDAATGRLSATLSGDTGPVLAVAVSRDGSWLATTGPGMVRIWDTRSRELVTVTRLDDTIYQCAWRDAGIFCGGSRGLFSYTFVGQRGTADEVGGQSLQRYT